MTGIWLCEHAVCAMLTSWHRCAGAQQSLGPAYYAGLLAAGSHLTWQIRTVDLDSRADCLAKFRSNRDFGALVFSAIVAGKYFA